jgi:hypothetical protein
MKQIEKKKLIVYKAKDKKKKIDKKFAYRIGEAGNHS